MAKPSCTLSRASLPVVVSGLHSISPAKELILMRSPKWLFVILLVVFAGLQYRLWVGEGSFTSAADLLMKIDEQKSENEKLQERNRILYAEILELKEGYETVEERARSELGMVKPGETLYQLIDATR